MEILQILALYWKKMNLIANSEELLYNESIGNKMKNYFLIISNDIGDKLKSKF